MLYRFLLFSDPKISKVVAYFGRDSRGQYTRGIREKFSDSKGFSTDRMIFKAPDGLTAPDVAMGSWWPVPVALPNVWYWFYLIFPA